MFWPVITINNQLFIHVLCASFPYTDWKRRTALNMHHLFFKEWLQSFTWRLQCWITAWVIVPPCTSDVSSSLTTYWSHAAAQCSECSIHRQQTRAAAVDIAAAAAAAAAEASVWWQPAAMTLRLSPLLNPTAPSAGQMLSVKWWHGKKCLQQACPSLEGNHQHKERGIYWLSYHQLQKNNLL